MTRPRYPSSLLGPGCGASCCFPRRVELFLVNELLRCWLFAVSMNQSDHGGGNLHS